MSEEDDVGSVEIEVVDKTSGTEEKVEVTAQPKTVSDDGELEEYSESVKKRIDRLTFKMRESERREQAALEYAKGVKAQLDRVANHTAVLDKSLATEAATRLQVQEQLVSDRMRMAIDRGDINDQILTQRAMAELTYERERLRQRPEPTEQQYYQPQYVQQPVQQSARPDPKAETWAERNSWFGADEPMTLTAFSHHKALVEKEGFDPSGDDYYEELDKRMRRDFPHKFQSRTAPTQQVASARNTARTNSDKIKLTSSQVAIAKRLGIKLEEYARQVKMIGGN